jgi:5-enolpyruvylshikimate-3-phosphate synthase
MGAHVIQHPRPARPSPAPAQLRGVYLDLSHMPDMTLTAAVLALHARGRTRSTAWRSSATTRATASPPQPPSSASSAPPSRSSPAA